MYVSIDGAAPDIIFIAEINKQSASIKVIVCVCVQFEFVPAKQKSETMGTYRISEQVLREILSLLH